MSQAKTAVKRKADDDPTLSPKARRKRKERRLHEEAGRKPVTVHVLPEFRPEVRELEAELHRREGRLKPPKQTKER